MNFCTYLLISADQALVTNDEIAELIALNRPVIADVISIVLVFKQICKSLLKLSCL